MPFALTLVHLEEALQKPGCPICRLGDEAARRSVDGFLWENVNDPESRRPLQEAYGFCPEHTRLLVTTEMESSGVLLGVNLIYESLARQAMRDLQKGGSLQSAPRGVWGWLERFRRRPTTPPDAPTCPLCRVVEEVQANALITLLEDLTLHAEHARPLYLRADGVCLPHLRQALHLHTQRFPEATRFLREETARRLETLAAHMREYIRKQNWAYRDEAMSEEERVAWLRVLVFFTGYSAERLVRRIEPF
ncbi:DUF6062 family protein [uncultured Thermanaerothrix sp.]|uniref:DUF6062 family protein n=1 Tax=uncultured Thermanaerothrix sp. TaxID=1195149 RepID=UPI00260376EE|nr:DUF6062 family protein [uncultured Thermanaerothrix sp.]